jgi:hypothetical protein
MSGRMAAEAAYPRVGADGCLGLDDALDELDGAHADGGRVRVHVLEDQGLHGEHLLPDAGVIGVIHSGQA